VERQTHSIAAMPRKPIAMAGASGFVGTHIRKRLSHKYHFRALTRSETLASHSSEEFSTEWYHCDLFSLPQMENALVGVDYAIYLVHSMLPSARLSQSSFEDLDLLLADNFARAAARSGLKQIIYLGGLIPDEGAGISIHLRSRREVERTLASTGVPVTSLRSGLIVGPGGSSLRMLVNLVRRLPVMVLPRWVQGRTHVIAVEDVVRAVDLALGHPEQFTGAYDLSTGENLTYRELINITADVLGLRRRIVEVPFSSVRFSRLWIQLFGGAPRSLTHPLVASLAHQLTAHPNPLMDRLAADRLSFREALAASIDEHGNVRPNPRDRTQPVDNRSIRSARRVRSVQRLPLPKGMSAEDVVRIYMKWLPSFMWPLVRVDALAHGGYSIRIRPFGICLIELTPSPITPTPDRKVFYITGGRLANLKAKPPGRFEFREVMDREFIMTAIHGYRPRLPWHFYNASQALAHLIVMKAFGRYLRRMR